MSEQSIKNKYNYLTLPFIISGLASWIWAPNRMFLAERHICRHVPRLTSSPGSGSGNLTTISIVMGKKYLNGALVVLHNFDFFNKSNLRRLCTDFCEKFNMNNWITLLRWDHNFKYNPSSVTEVAKIRKKSGEAIGVIDIFPLFTTTATKYEGNIKIMIWIKQY